MRRTHVPLPADLPWLIALVTLAAGILAGHILLIVAWEHDPARQAVATGLVACAILGGLTAVLWARRRGTGTARRARSHRHAAEDDLTTTMSLTMPPQPWHLGWPAALGGLTVGLYACSIVLVFTIGEGKRFLIVNAMLSLCTIMAFTAAAGWVRWSGRQANAGEHQGLGDLISGGHGALGGEVNQLRRDLQQVAGQLAAQTEQLEARMDQVQKALTDASDLYWRHLSEQTRARMAAGGDVIPISQAQAHRRPES